MATFTPGDDKELQTIIRDHMTLPYLFGDFHPSHIQEYAGGLLLALEKPAKDGFQRPDPHRGTPKRHHRGRDLPPKPPATTQHLLRGVTTTKEPTTDGNAIGSGGRPREPRTLTAPKGVLSVDETRGERTPGE
jgi:hypothetical protein